jgi:hypothetical protein
LAILLQRAKKEEQRQAGLHEKLRERNAYYPVCGYHGYYGLLQLTVEVQSIFIPKQILQMLHYTYNFRNRMLN